MPLSGYPLNTKYTPADPVYIFLEGRILPVTVTEWRVTVIVDPGNASLGIQQIWYKFAEVSGEFPESQVFSSRNHLKFYVTGRHLNRAILSGSGGSAFATAGAQEDSTPEAGVWPSFGTWTDLAGFDLAGANFNNEGDFDDVEGPWDIDYTNTVFDGSILDLARLPDGVDTKEDFQDTVFSYDADTTIWIDGDPIGRP